ncbi:MAG: hypothetical protein V3U02_04030 [Calditrichia bacterium]
MPNIAGRDLQDDKGRTQFMDMTNNQLVFGVGFEPLVMCNKDNGTISLHILKLRLIWF